MSSHQRPDSSCPAMEVAQRQQFFLNLLKALGPLSEKEKRKRGSFASCEAIRPSQGFVLKSLHVEGAGELQLPLSAEDTSKLRSVCEQAPFTRDSATLVDTNVRRCWQVDASKVSFPMTPAFLLDTIQPLAVKAVRALGVDGAGVQLEAHLYKLLFYEVGGHFTIRKGSDKEKGTFATLIIQLPTEEGYRGGELVVKHLNEVKTFDCQIISALGCCYTVFFADCLHKLRKIKSGTRLCLAFNLIRRDSNLCEPFQRGFISRRVQKAEAALQPWLNAGTERNLNFVGRKLAFPLQHKYTQTNLSFARLKGDDKILAEVLKNCRDQNKEKWLDLHLCLVTKYQYGTASSPQRYSRRSRTYSDSDSNSDSADPHTMEDVLEQYIKFKKWIGLDDQPTSVAWIKKLRIDFAKEVVVEKQYDDCPFDSEPDETEYEENIGNLCPTLEYWYHAALLVVWPKALSISLFCEVGVSSALDFLETTFQISDPKFRVQLHQIVGYCRRNPLQVWERGGNSKNDSVTPRLIRLCTKINLREDASQIFQVLAEPLPPYGRHRFKIGVRNVEVAKAIAAAVQEFGWGFLSSLLLDLAKTLAFIQGESFAELAKQLITMGNQDAGQLVANTIFQVYEAHISQQESQMPPQPVFTWCQPRARLPDHPTVESFLRGPTEKLVLTGFPRIAEARAFSQNYCSTTNAGYNVIGTPFARGPDSFCEIKKTRIFFDAAHENWRKKQDEVKRLRLELGKLRSAVPKPSADTMTTLPDRSGQGSGQRDREGQNVELGKSRSPVSKPSPGTVTTLPEGPCQRHRKRQRLDEVTGDTTKNCKASPKAFIDLTLNISPEKSRNKRAKSTSANELIDLTADVDENEGV